MWLCSVGQAFNKWSYLDSAVASGLTWIQRLRVLGKLQRHSAAATDCWDSVGSDNKRRQPEFVRQLRFTTWYYTTCNAAVFLACYRTQLRHVMRKTVTTSPGWVCSACSMRPKSVYYLIRSTTHYVPSGYVRHSLQECKTLPRTLTRPDNSPSLFTRYRTFPRLPPPPCANL